MNSSRELGGPPTPNRTPTAAWRPRVRVLEPRIVLNATAELLAMGDLFISGDAADDTVDVTLNAAGEIQIFDANGVVPIRIGTDPIGNPITVNSLDPNLISTGRLSADLSDGNDSLRIDVPVGLDITAVGGNGNDSIAISLHANGLGVSDNTLRLDAEQIHIDGRGDGIDLTTSTLQSAGTAGVITINNTDSLVLGEIDVADGSLRIGNFANPLDGAISQAAGTSVSASLVSLHVDSDVDLSNAGNTIGTIDAVLYADASGISDNTLYLVAEQIHIDGRGDGIDLTSSTLESAGTAGVITINNADLLLLGEIDVADGSLRIGNFANPLDGAISQAAGTSVSASLVSLHVASDVNLSNAGNTIGTVDAVLYADATGISDSSLRLVAEKIHIDGRGDGIDFSTSVLESVGSTGEITISDANSLVLGEIDVADGSLQMGSVGSPLDGAISQAIGTRISAALLSVHVASDVDLSNVGNSIGTIDRIQSGGNVNLLSDVSSRPGSTMTVHQIETTSGNVRGDIRVGVTGSVELISSNPNSDTVLLTENGEISVVASEGIRILDFIASNDGTNATANHEVIAGGDNGRVVMLAGGSWIAGDAVQIYASQITDGAVRINAATVVIGNDFAINTGDGIGIAHRFGPRPELEVIAPGQIRPVYPGAITNPADPNYVKIETAFYDADSVRTGILTQANQNDASGVLSIDIGAAGENGLTLSIDWGGQSNRFQQLDNLAGDHTRVDMSHVYLESDILNSTLNGRGSATDPLAVRFSVSHHASIVVTGDSIDQAVPPNQVVTAGGPTLQSTVPGRLISSTDNPLTGPLESGLAFFVIPRVNVPLAFLPDRDVLPDPIEPTPPVILTSSIQLNNVLVEAVDVSATPASIRDEFFQLRTLSPDPNGEDLIDPIRLPDSILAEDRLDELFAELPDGAYEIDYVIGNSDVRMILRVDLRGGQAVIVDNDIEGVPLELEDLEDLDIADPIETLEVVPANELDHGPR